MAVTAQQGVGTSHNKLLEKPWLESLLLWCWHSSAELCFESRHRKSIHLDLTGADFCSRWMSSLLWLNRCIILLEPVSGRRRRWRRLGSFTRRLPLMTQSESPGICPVTRTKTGMGSDSSYSNSVWAGPSPRPPPLPSPTPPGQCSFVLEPREGEDVNTLRCCTKADSLGRAAYVYKLEFSF